MNTYPGRRTRSEIERYFSQGTWARSVLTKRWNEEFPHEVPIPSRERSANCASVVSCAGRGASTGPELGWLRVNDETTTLSES